MRRKDHPPSDGVPLNLNTPGTYKASEETDLSNFSLHQLSEVNSPNRCRCWTRGVSTHSFTSANRSDRPMSGTCSKRAICPFFRLVEDQKNTPKIARCATCTLPQRRCRRINLTDIVSSIGTYIPVRTDGLPVIPNAACTDNLSQVGSLRHFKSHQLSQVKQMGPSND